MLTFPEIPRGNLLPGRVVLALVAMLWAGTLTAQVRPPGGGGGGTIPVDPGTGRPTPPGGGAVNPGNPGTGLPGTPTVRIVTPAGVLAGESNAAAAAVAGGGQIIGGGAGGGGAAAGATYQWTISGGRITTDSTRPTVSYVADSAGSITLNVAVTLTGNIALSSSIQVQALSAASAGEIVTQSNVATNATTVSARITGDASITRTFRWTASGGATILGGQGTDTIQFRPGSAGLKEITCTVNLMNLVTVPVRSYVVVAGDGPSIALTINNGAGGGTYAAGSRVDIFAHPPPAGQVFDRWTGDTSVFGTGPGAALAPALTHTVITVPATPVTLTATYKPAPAWTPTVVTSFNPIQVRGPDNTTATVTSTLHYHIPANATAVVFLLHDAGGSGAGWFNRPEPLLLARDLVAAGYGVAALDSVNRTAGTWNGQAALANNPDAANIAAALDKFARDGALAATKPVFLLGFANGADAATRFAALLAASRPVRGAVLYCATGGPGLAVTSRVPQFFALTANDTDLGAAGNATAREHSQILAGRGIATNVVTNIVSPVHAARFRALGITAPAFTATDAQAIWTAVKNAGLLDPNNYLKSIPTAAVLTAALPAAYQHRLADVAAQLEIAYAEREFYSDANARVIAFLGQRVADAPVPPPGRLVNLSTRTKIAFVGDAFALGFSITGPERTTLLIRGIGPALARFGLAGALAAPRLEINQGPTLVASNEGWSTASNAAQIAAAAANVGAFALAEGDLDTAVLLTLEPGTYTATLKGLNGATGDVLAEVYDVGKNATRLTNLSTLARIDGEGELLVPGIVVEGTSPRTLVLRAIGPGLADFGFPTEALLGDPRIAILNSTGQSVAANNNWSQGGATGAAATLNAAFPAVGAFPLRVASDAAMIDVLAPGSYTLQVGAAPLPAANPGGAAAPIVAPNQTGSVLVEVYEVP